MNVLYIFDRDSSDRPESTMIITLSKMGVKPTVICAPNTPFEAALQKAEIATLPVNFRSKIDLRAIGQIRTLLHSKSFDLVHIFHKKPLVNYTFASIGIKLPVVAYRGIIGNLSYWDPFSWLSFLNPRINRIICVCEAVRRYFLEKRFLLFFSLFNPNRVVTIHKGHETAWYAQPEKPNFSEIGIPENAYVIGCVARLKARKGIVELIRSLEYIKADKPVYLILIGRVEDKRIPGEIEKSPLKPQIKLLGFRKDASMLAGGFDCVALPSLRREGLPRAIIEAMSQGIPAVVTDSGGSPELVRDEIDGQIVAPGDIKALADGLSWVLADSDRHAQLSRNAKARIEKDFTVKKTADETLRLYGQILQEKNSRNG